jgi:hypothetical protein
VSSIKPNCSGAGLQAATLADTGVVAGPDTSADVTVDPKGRMTGASNGVAAVGAATKVIILQGDSVSIYPAPGLAPINTLLRGFSSQDELSSTPFNFSASGFGLALQQMGNANVWYAETGQIIDPTSVDWSEFTLIWFYR